MFGYVRVIYHNGFILTGVAILGAAGSVAGVVASALGSLPDSVWTGVIAGSFLASAVVNRPKWTEVYDFPGGGWRIEVLRGDLFEQPCSIVVTTDQEMSTSMLKVGPDSLVGQLIERWFQGESSLLDASIEGGRPSGSPGLTARFGSSPPGGGWLLSLARSQTGSSVTTWQDLAIAHESLWAAVRSANNHDVAVPIIGAGFAHAKLPYRALAVMLAVSFHAASLEGRVCTTLRIVMSPDDFDPRVFRTLASLLEALEYKRR